MTSYSFSQLISFTRTTSGTYTNSAGLLTSTPASVNLLTYTQEFSNAVWAKTNATVTADTVAAPDGTPTADTLLASAGAGLTPRVGDTANPTTTTSAAYTASIYVKGGTYTFFQIYLNNQSAEWANFTLTGAGTATANGSCTATITALGGDWYRCTMSYTAGGADRRPFFMMAASGSATRAQTWSPAGTESIYIWGAQLEQASAASTYTANYGGLYPPRFDYDPVTLAPKGLLIEEQRTNLATYSDAAGSWAGFSGVSVTSEATTSPDGTVDADKVVESSDLSAHFVSQTSSPVSYISGSAYTRSCWLKASGRRYASVYLPSSNFAASGRGAIFDLQSGTVQSAEVGVTAKITAFLNGWYRCATTATASVTGWGHAGGTALFDNSLNGTYTGDGVSGVFIYGAQLEAGAFATSYIPTVASTVTRSKDVAKMTGTNFSSWYNQSEGTFVVGWDGFKPTTASGAPTIFQVGNGTTSFIDTILSGGAYLARVFVGGVSQAEFTPLYVANVTERFATAYKVNDFAFSRNGATALVDTSGSVPTDADRIGIGSSQTETFVLNGHIRSIQYYPTRLTDAQLQALTA